MFHILQERRQQGFRTAAYPAAPPNIPDRFRGLPILDSKKCDDGCRACVDACPTGAVRFDDALSLDLGKCLFCTDCTSACPTGAVRYSTEYRLAVRNRE